MGQIIQKNAMERFQVLLVEDSKKCQLMVGETFQGSSINLKKASSAREAVHFLNTKDEQFDLVLLDCDLPDEHGLKVLTSVRSNQQTQDLPVFILTARNDIESKVSAFSLGADDYITKPVDSLELYARVEMRIKKYKLKKKPIHRLNKGELTLDIPLIRATVNRHNEEEILDLTTKEFKILAFLAQNEGDVFSRSDLVKAVWGEGTHVQDRTVDSHICGLRRKLGSLENYIQCIPGAGYRFLTLENFEKSQRTTVVKKS